MSSNTVNFPKIKVVMTYYEDGTGHRTEYAVDAIWSLIAHLRYSGKLELHIADDSEDREDENVNQLLALGNKWGSQATYSCSHHNGIGASLNLALAKVKDLWLYTTDDWQLNKDLNLDKAVKLIKQNSYDYVRLGPLHPNLECRTRFQEQIGWWLEVDQGVGFAFATRPFLSNLDLFNIAGRFAEGMNSYEVERLYAEQFHSGRIISRFAGYLSDGEEWTHLGKYTVGEREVIHSA